VTALREIVRTCSNAHVARAALASIGGEFAQRFADDASRRDLPSGVLAARLVRAFAMNAGDEDWEAVSEATRGADQPILSGLRYILDRGLRGEAREENALPRETPPAWAICASRGGLWRE
jgi:hypothetical protein